MAKKELTVVEDTMTVPDYLKSETATGIDGLDASDYALPRIKLLQGLSPELKANPEKARIGHFWHNGANISLGSEFKLILAGASKRVILWEPSKSGKGKLLAYSANAVDWTSGGDKEFEVPTRDGKHKVKYHTRKNVAQSGLLNFGTSDPSDEKSAPAASLMYEYCCYLPDYPELSPCLYTIAKTGVSSAKKFNTLMLTNRKPIQSIVVRCVAQDESNDRGEIWTIPSFNMIGYATEQQFKEAKGLGEKYNQFSATYKPEADHVEDYAKDIDDKINY